MFPKQNDRLQVMSHAVVGFPTLDENEKAIAGLVASGVNLIELQVPFSDPVADGHTLVNACYHALKNGGSVRATLDLCAKVSKQHPDASFILMSYLNPLYRYGLERLFRDAAAAGFKGMIIPDMPVEQFEPHMSLLDELGLAPILMVTPNTPDERVARIAQSARGMVYVVSRMGVTGKQTHWDDDFRDYVARIRRYTDLPLAIGFGIRSADDLKALTGTAEVAAFCSKYIEWQRDDGSEVAAQKMKTLLTEAELV
ncbi:tryptophan synthase subunit alpha [Nitrincola nitratireducens]|uniref:Tryptophan synthase alpha chain n=1 Tax=Nitrincola nitratireducens TaxID=1229521 RepID=W9V044_9GAMM|nr:tryptophan synthase subunit alpha [Nitrincola nitratireducens]EXJ12833.1 Tryptophan synthase alpha chain [Nitrincola nitratireducens]